LIKPNFHVMRVTLSQFENFKGTLFCILDEKLVVFCRKFCCKALSLLL